MANLIPPNTPTPDDVPISGTGSIDNELLRDKFTARQRLFWNQTNQSGRKWARDELSYKSPNLQLDPRVQYRTAGPNAYEDFLKTGIVRGTWADHDGGHAKLFMSQGAPLYSYGEQALKEGENAYLFATLGENWGDRESNIKLTPEDIAQIDSRDFQLTEAFTKDEHKQIDLLKKSLKELSKKEFTQLNPITGEMELLHTDANIDYLLRKHENILDRISSSMSDVKKHLTSKAINSQHPLVSWMDEFEGRKSGAARGLPHAFMMRRDNPDSTGSVIRVPIDTTNLAETIKYLRPSVSGGYSTQNYTPLYNFIRKLQELHKTDTRTEADRIVNPDKPVNPFLSSKGWNNSGLDTTVGFQNSSIAGTDVHPSLQLYNESGEIVSQSTKPFLGSYYDYVNGQITPDLVRLGAVDDNSPTWLSRDSIAKFLTNSLSNDVVYNNGYPFPLAQANFLTHGRQGAMHTERVPRGVVEASGKSWDSGFRIDEPVTGTLLGPDGGIRKWDFAAQSINANTRPMAVFRINPEHPDGIELIHQFNNEPLPDGTLPIPVKPPSEQAIVDSAKRFLGEEVPKLNGVTIPDSVQADLLAGRPVAGLSEIVAAGSSVNQLWHQMGGITDPQSFYGLQNVINESTRGNPAYGKKGFLDLKAYLGGFKEMVTPEFNGEGMIKFFSNPENVSKVKNLYSTNPEFASWLTGEVGGRVLRTANKLGEVAAVATTPMMVRDRLGAYVKDYYERTGKDPRGQYTINKRDTFQNTDNLADDLSSLGVLSGFENALDFATFGNYDHWTDNEVMIKHKEVLDNYAAMEDAMEPYSPFKIQTLRRQAGIDNPVYNGRTLTRTTK